MLRRLKTLLLSVLALLLGAAVWLPVLHLFYQEDAGAYFESDAVPPKVERLAARQLRMWEDAALREQTLARMRNSNAEWDFMGRTFLVLALSELALKEPAKQARHLAVIDRIIDETIRLEKERGMYHFLMPYARRGRFVQQPARSVFLDGEIALMLGARRLVQEKPSYKKLFTERVDPMLERILASPVKCAESYPDECWMFCNAAAMVAVRMGDVLDGTDHGKDIDRWLEAIRKHLVHEPTGLLVSAFEYRGKATHGPEGSSIWFVTHCLRVLDADFAHDQFERAKKELGRNILGFGFGAEWPASWVGKLDVDSGAVIPFLDISAGSSGMAFLAAASFRDEAMLRSLLTTIEFAGMPREDDGALRYCASNQVGDAVLLYSLCIGPLWERLRRPQR